MDPFELLKRDHEAVSQLFKRIESASGKAKLRVFQQIKSELEVHTHIEEAIFYPVLEKAKETRDLTLEAYEEHKVVKSLLGELDAAKEVSDEWEAKLTVLRENVEHHVDEEENDLFDKANDVLTGEEAESLGDRMQAEKVKRGGASASNTTTQKPGLLRKIANALGVGGSSQKASKASSKKRAKKKAVKKGGKVAAKLAPSKSTGASAAKKGSGAGKGKRGSDIKSSPAKRAAKKSGAGKRPATSKTAAKRTRRGR